MTSLKVTVLLESRGVCDRFVVKWHGVQMFAMFEFVSGMNVSQVSMANTGHFSICSSFYVHHKKKIT